MSRLLVIDDEPAVVNALRRLLSIRRPEWELYYAPDIDEGLRQLKTNRYDVATLDIKMPGGSGFDLLNRLSRFVDVCTTPIVVVTGEGGPGAKRHALELGAWDLMSKPVDPDEFVSRIESLLRKKVESEILQEKKLHLSELVTEQTQALEASRLALILRLAKAAEIRDTDTGLHIARVAVSSALLAQALGQNCEFVRLIFFASALHDIGKIGLPDSVLLKDGQLTDEDRRCMERHCEYGSQLLEEDPRLCSLASKAGLELPRIDWKDPITEMANRIVLEHHERWDGSGYPRKLARMQISLEARIVAVTDCFDAMTNHKTYRKALSFDEGFEYLQKNSDVLFDPQAVRAFTGLRQKIAELRD